MIHTIRGNGKISIDEQAFEIGTLAAQNYIDKREKFIEKLRIDSALEEIEIIYIINDKLIKMQNENIIYIEGQNIDKIDVQLHKTSR